MKPVIDLDKEYGLILEGGGAKGAFQIGVWKALREAGVKIKGIAGTSVGGLNGALICADDFEAAVRVWENLTYSKIMTVNDDVVSGLLNGTLSMKESLSAAMAFLKNGGVDVTPLKEMIAEIIDPKTIKESPMDFYVTTFNIDKMKEEQINLKEVDDDLIYDYLLATAYMAPVFKVEKLHGVHYVDGGAADNVPVDVLLNHGYQDLIIVRIYGIGMLKKVEIPEDVSLLEIAPRSDLGSILEFDGKRSRHNITKGYLDGMRAIYNLKGLIYYIDEEHGELHYLYQLLDLNSETRTEISQMHRGEDPDKLWFRHMTEKVLPSIASKLKLGADWTYQELFLGMLEATAKMCGVPKNRIYTLEELMSEVASGLDMITEADQKLDFVKIVKCIVQKERES